MNGPTRPLRLPGAASMHWLCARAQAAVEVWASAWVSGWAGGLATAAMIEVSAACELDRQEQGGYCPVRSEGGCLWVRRDELAWRHFGRALFGGDLQPGLTQADDWIADIAERGWDARNQALCAALFGAAPGPRPWEATLASSGRLPRELFAFGSGAVGLWCEPLGLHAIADAGVWAAMPPASRDPAHRLPHLGALDHAVQGSPVRLEIMLGSVELDLPVCLDMRDGDVLRLPQRLDQPLEVTCAGLPVAHARLGEVQGQKCVRLLAKPPDNKGRTTP